MTKQKKDNSNILQWIIPSIMLVLFLVVTLFNYSADMEKQIRERVDEKQEVQTKEMGGYYEETMNAMLSLASVSAGNFSKMEDVFSPEARELLKTIVRNTSVQDAVIIKMDGSALNSVGRDPQISKKLNIEEYLDGKTHVSELFQYTNSLRYQTMVTAPIKTENEMIGIVAIIVPLDSLGDITSGASYSIKNTYGVIGSDGVLIERAGNPRDFIHVGANVLSGLESTEITDGTYKKLIQNMEANKGGKLVFNYTNEKAEAESYYLFYEPIGDYGWYTVTLITTSQIERVVKDEQRMTTNLVTKMLVAILIFVAILVAINVITRARYVKESKELQDKAETDLLTDLLNKIATEKKIREYLEGEGKDKRAIMFVLDIDNFKKINDTMGHAFGDEVLSTLGRRIKSEFRINDIVGRTGGDEFVVFLKDMKDEDTMKREAERVATFFKNFKVGEYVKYSATASIGASIYPTNARDFETLYKAADQALYKAKRRGKNQLAFYEDNDLPRENDNDQFIEQNV